VVQDQSAFALIPQDYYSFVECQHYTSKVHLPYLGRHKLQGPQPRIATMVDLDTSAQFHLSNPVLNSTKVIAFTRDNNIIVIEDVSSTDNQRWYLTATNDSTLFRLHTVQKGDYYALDTLNYDASNFIDIEFLDVVDGMARQLWSFDTWPDGSLKISNNLTGLHLEYLEGDSAPKLADGDSDGQHWSTGSSTSDASATTISYTTSTAGATNNLTKPAASTTGSATVTGTPTPTPTATGSPSSHHTSTGVIVGSTVGGVAAAAALGYIAWRIWKGRRTPAQPAPAYRPREQSTTEYHL
jgi:hypothetical protein